MFKALAFPAFGLILLVGGPVVAQDLSDDELLQIFQRQRDAFSEAREGGGGATRGLTLLTVDDLATSPDLAPAADLADATSPGLAPAADLADATAPLDAPFDLTAPVDLAAPDDLTAPDGAPPVAQADVATPEPPVVAADDGAGTGPDPADGTVVVEASDGLGDPADADDVGATLAAAADTAAPRPEPVVFGQLAAEIQVNLRITFAFDSATLADDQRPKLDQLCGVMKGSDIDLFRIVGHTDASGPDIYNERLSLLRAQEVRRYFIDTCGMAPDRLEALGLGERFLFDGADPGAADNRRVEFQALS